MRPRPLLLFALASALAFGLVLVSLPEGSAQTSPGQLDDSFDDDGITSTNIGPYSVNASDTGQAVVSDEDGELIVAGYVNYTAPNNTTGHDMAIVKYRLDGSLNDDFGEGAPLGKTFVHFNGAEIATDLIIQPDDDKIVVVGSTHNGLQEIVALTRLHSNGTIDTDFGNNGRVTLALGNQAQAAAVGLQRDTDDDDLKIVVAGVMNDGNGSHGFVARFDPNGDVDVDFGVNGVRVVTDPSGPGVSFYALAVQPDGKIIVGGARGGAGRVQRLTRNGDPDASFGTGGVVEGLMNVVWDIALQADGKIVAAGSSNVFQFNNLNSAVTVARLNADGTPDAGFREPGTGGNGGTVVTNVNGGHDEARGLVITPNGKIFVGGTAAGGAGGREFVVVRYDEDGRLDTQFDGDGIATPPNIYPENFFGYDVAQDPQGRFVIAGNADSFQGSDFAVARFHGGAEDALAADLELTKTVSRSPALVERNLTYTLTVNNHGPDTAYNVVATDTLPAGPTFVSVTTSQGTCQLSNGTVTCQLGSLSNGAAATIEIKVKPRAAGTLINNASVTGAEPDPDTSNNSATVTTQAVVAADLLLTKTASRNPALVNQILTYTVKVTNSSGPADATNVVVTDALPAGPNFVSVVSTQGACAHASGVVTCQLGTLPVNAQATITIKIKPLAEGTLTNNASASAAEYDPDTANNSDTVQTPAVRSADLSIKKKDSADPVLLDGNVTYTLTINNSGPVGAAGVTLTDALPASMTFVSATTSQGSLTTPPVGSSGTVTGNLGSLAVGATATVTITVKATQAGTFTNTASVAGDDGDENAANNTHKQQTTVVTLQKLLLSASTVVGGCQPYPTGVVYLTGPAPAGGVNVDLSSTNGAASPPSFVLIAAGQTKSAPFTITTSQVTTQQTGSIKATLAAKTVSRSLTVRPSACP